jgi:hypothetical protein
LTKRPKPESEPAPAASAAEGADKSGVDVALIHSVGPDGSVHVIRRRGEHVEAGALSPVREGKPIHGELVSLKPRPSCPLLCDVQVHYKPPVSEPPTRASGRGSGRRKGPAQVATDRYRDNWDSIWSQKKSDALN